MNSRSRTRVVAAVVIAGLWAASAGARPKPRPRTRSLYVPITIRLCEHLEGGLVYQDDEPVARTPAERIFQFTYYPELERLMPDVVQIRVEGRYVGDGEPFVARLAVTPEGLHTASSHRSLETVEQLRKQRHKLDARLEERDVRLVCPRECARRRVVAAASVEEPR